MQFLFLRANDLRFGATRRGEADRNRRFEVINNLESVAGPRRGRTRPAARDAGTDAASISSPDVWRQNPNHWRAIARRSAGIEVAHQHRRTPHSRPKGMSASRKPMSLSQGDFDPLVVVGHWLDACRSGDQEALLNLYDERATLECHCEHLALQSRVQPLRHGPNSRWGSSGLPKQRRQTGPNALSFQSLGQDTPHKLRSIRTLNRLVTLPQP